MSYRVLAEFENLFAGHAYLHRNSSLGDFVAMHLFEDLLAINRSTKLPARVAAQDRIVNTANLAQGIRARRGDGTFGEAVPGLPTILPPGFAVARGKVATVEIGVETKILAKAMIKQIDRVANDLKNQVSQFKRSGRNPICVALVGINQAPYAVSYEGERTYHTDGKANRHPFQEAGTAETRLQAEVGPHYDEFVVFRYSATNESPFLFSWVDYQRTFADYGAALVRISREYDRRF